MSDMTIRRIYCPLPLAADTELILDAAASTHMVRVLRLQKDDAVILFNGEGGEYSGTVVVPDKKAMRVTLNQFNDANRESPLSIVLGQGVSRGERMDFTIRKATELGVTEIVPLMTKRCTIRLDKKRAATKVEHWRKIVISACEQCGRNRLPTVAMPQTIDQWLESGNFSHAMVLSPNAENGLTKTKPPPGPVTILAGPEGGLSDTEIAQVCAAGFLPVHLGPRVLRTETAALAALSAIQTCYGDMR